MSAFQRVFAFLGAVRRRLLWVHLLAGLTAGISAGAGVWLMCALGATAIGPAAVWPALALVGVLGAALAALARFAILPLFRLRRAAAVARQVGTHAPALSSDLLSTVELERELPALEREPRFSRELVEALAQQTADALSRLQVHRVAPARPLKRPLQALAALGALFGLLAVVAPGWLQRAAHALGRRGPLAAEPSDEPIVGDITLTLTYPQYSGLAPKVMPNTSGDVLALKGTEVQIETRALLPAKQATLVLGEGDARATELAGGVLRARFRIEGPTTYRFVLGLAGGRAVREPAPHKVEIDPDRPPKVDLFAPSEDLELAGPKIVELGFAAEDDYGLSEIALAWQVGSGPEQRKVLRTGIGTRSAQGRHDWDLAEVGLRAGARVAYRIEARDTDTVSGPNLGSSRTFYLRLTSPREKHEVQIERQAELLEEILRALAERLEAPPPTDEQAARVLDAFSAAHEREQAAVTLAARLSDQAKADAMAPKELRPALAGIAERLGRLVQGESEPLSEAQGKRRRGLLRPALLTRLSADSPKHVSELESDALKLDDLLGRQRLEDVAALANEAAAAKKRLQQLLEKFRRTRDEATRKEIEREMRELAARLREIQQKLAELAQKHEVPDEFLNAKLDKNALADLEHLEEMLRRGDLDAAARELEKLSRAIEDMQAALSEDLRGFRGERFAAEEKALSEMLDKVGDLEHAQKQIADDTHKVLDRQREKTAQLMKDRIDQFVKKELEKVARLQKRTHEIPQDPLAPFDQEELERARRRIEDLKKTLDQGDLEQALEMARQAHGSLKSIDDDMAGELGRMSISPRARQDMDLAQRKLGEALPVAKEIVDDLEKAMPSPQELLGAEDRKRLQELGGRQQGLKKRLEQILQEAEQRTKEAPGIGEAPPALRGAQADMQRSEGNLRGAKPRDAFQNQKQALEKLADLRRNMQRQRRPTPSGAEGREVGTERIKIPGADEFRAPKEWREQILEAAKEAGKAPEPYRGQVKKYYEEIVK